MGLFPGFYPGVTSFPGGDPDYPPVDPGEPQSSRDSTWYLGPLGGLRPLLAPKPGVSLPDVRYGGVHQGLSGARTMDVTGYRANFTFDWTYMDHEEWRWLELLHTRHIPGPFRLINPLKRNRLSLHASRLLPLTSNFAGRLGALISTPYVFARDFPTEFVDYPGRSLRLANWTGEQGYVQFDPNCPTPTFAEENIVISVCLKAEAPVSNVRFQINWFDSDGDPMYNQASAPFDIGTEWDRYPLTGITVPEDAAAGKMAVTFEAYSAPVYLAAPQWEGGTSLHEWEPGGGAPEVLVDQLTTTSPRFPLRDGTLTLLEA